MKKFIYENGLSLTLLVVTVLTLGGNLLTGWHELNNDSKSIADPPSRLGNTSAAATASSRFLKTGKANFCKWACTCGSPFF